MIKNLWNLKQRYLKININYLIFILCFQLCNSQNLDGIVLDSLNNPIQNANIIVKDLKDNIYGFTTTNEKGVFVIKKDSLKHFKLVISHLLYKTDTLFFNKYSPTPFKIKLLEKKENLKEVVITYKIPPITLKKDTITYDVKKFSDGTERKLQEQLEKLPGVKVDENGNVTLNGRNVNTLLVENTEFFGGTKLGVQYLPADAIDKVEFIDHFNDTSTLKSLNITDQLALNIKLKEEKKNLIFGDIKVGSDFKNYHLFHAPIFLFNKKRNLSIINDWNNIGERTITNQDLEKFGNNFKSVSNQNKVNNQLFNNLSQNNRDFSSINSLFNGINFNSEISKSFHFNGQLLFSTTKNEFEKRFNINYLTLNETETRFDKAENNLQTIFANFKTKYFINQTTSLINNIHVEIYKQISNNNLESRSEQFENKLDINNKINNLKMIQISELHKTYTPYIGQIIHISSSFLTDSGSNFWNSNNPFFNNSNDLINISSNSVKKHNESKLYDVEFVVKNFFQFKNGSQINLDVGVYKKNHNVQINEFEFIGNEFILLDSNFNNQIQQRFNEYIYSVEYAFELFKLKNKAMLKFRNVTLKNIQSSNTKKDELFFEPQYIIEYDFSKTEKFSLNANYSYGIPFINQFFEKYSINNFNSISIGNIDLNFERYFNFNTNYQKNNFTKGFNIFSTFNYSKSFNRTGNNYEFVGINNISNTLNFKEPEKNIFLFADISYRQKKWEYGIGFLISNNSFNQSLNNQTEIVEKNLQNISFFVTYNSIKHLNFKFRYSKQFEQLIFESKNIQTIDKLNINSTLKLSNNYSIKSTYTFNYLDSNSYSQFFNILDTSILYKKKSNPWSFELKAHNILNNSEKINLTLNNFQATNQRIIILPRIFMFSVNYIL